MITIRYEDLPEGLHVQATVQGRRTIILLRPGLTPRQRREGLRRALHSAHMGYGPPLSERALALALVAHRIRATLANAGAAIRWHPLGAALAAAAFATLVTCYLMLVSASIQIIPDPLLQDVTPPPAPSASPSALPSPHPTPPGPGPSPSPTILEPWSSPSVFCAHVSPLGVCV